ncbi:MAG: alpha/beta fold hydrolase [Vicingaceae bacterium]
MEVLTWTLIILIILGGIIAGILFSFYFLQEKLIFSPIKLPKNYNFPFKAEYEERFYEVEEGVELNALLFKAEKSKGLIFYIHGNADNLRYWGDFAPFFLKRNYDVFIYDFRGFGKSGGTIKGEKNLQRDAKILYHEMLKEYAEEQIIVYGFSLGTGIAARLGSKNQPKALILEAPYFNFIELVKYHKAYLPANLISKYHFRTNRYLSKVEVPLYIFHGTEDRKVPYFLGAKLKGVNPNLTFVTIKGAAHSDMQAMKKYRKWMSKLLA